MRYVWSILTILSVMLLSAPATAEQSVRLGPWEVHYNAFNSTFLRPEMAQQYNLQRSGTLATLNIAVLAANDPAKTAQQVNISGYSMNPLSMQNKLEFTEVIEGEAVYYLTQVRFSPNERLRFFIDIEQGEERQQLRFNQEFWAND